MLYRYYRIKSLTDKKTYIGRTHFNLNVRLDNHKRSLKLKTSKDKNSLAGCGSFAIIQDKVLGIDYEMELINQFDIDSELESKIVEQIYLDEERAINIGNVVNKRNAYISKEQKKQQQKQSHKIYYEKNKDKILDHKKQYYDNNRISAGENKKKYYEQNKTELLEYAKKYREEHKTELSDRDKVKFTCECGKTCRKAEKARHCKSSRHQKYIKNLNSVELV